MRAEDAELAGATETSGSDARARLRLAALSLAALLLSPGARAADPAAPPDGAGEAAPAAGEGAWAPPAEGAAAEASDAATAAPAHLEEEVVVCGTSRPRSS